MSKTEPGKLVNGNESSILIKNKYLIKETTIFLSFLMELDSRNISKKFKVPKTNRNSQLLPKPNECSYDSYLR